MVLEFGYVIHKNNFRIQNPVVRIQKDAEPDAPYFKKQVELMLSKCFSSTLT
jgi:hypothetical protein